MGHERALQRMLDQHTIRETVLRYCRAVDRCDFAAVRDVYTADGLDHHTGFSGSADDYVAWITVKLSAFEGTTHIVGNHLSELNGDEAVSETYGTAVHWGVQRDDPALNFTSGFRYVDHFRRDDDKRWRIVERFAVREWTRAEAGMFVTAEAPGPRGSRGPDDPLHVMRAAVLALGSD